MLLNKENKTIYCFLCNMDYSLDPFEVFINVLYEGSISCLQEHLIGNTSDLEWQDYFYNYNCSYYYLYHNKGQCRCVQEETNCEGLEYNCGNECGKKTYEDDLEEIK